MKTNIFFIILFVGLLLYWGHTQNQQKAQAEQTQWVVVGHNAFKKEDANQVIVRKFVDGDTTCYVSFLTTTWTSAGISCVKGQ